MRYEQSKSAIGCGGGRLRGGAGLCRRGHALCCGTGGRAALQAQALCAACIRLQQRRNLRLR